MFFQRKICLVSAVIFFTLATLQTTVQAKQVVRVRGRPRSELPTFSAVPESGSAAAAEPATTSTARKGKCPEQEGLQVMISA
jgi:hypothetical protein